MPLSLLLGGPLDYGLLLALILGLFFLLACFAAVGLFFSTLTAQPIIAAISTIGSLLLLWIIDLSGYQSGESVTSSLLAYISIKRHFETLSLGSVNSSDIVYFVLFITLFLVLGIRRLDADRLQH
jgi:ABC-2 type transport system permease protein